MKRDQHLSQGPLTYLYLVHGPNRGQNHAGQTVGSGCITRFVHTMHCFVRGTGIRLRSHHIRWIYVHIELFEGVGIHNVQGHESHYSLMEDIQ